MSSHHTVSSNAITPYKLEKTAFQIERCDRKQFSFAIFLIFYAFVILKAPAAE